MGSWEDEFFLCLSSKCYKFIVHNAQTWPVMEECVNMFVIVKL